MKAFERDSVVSTSIKVHHFLQLLPIKILISVSSMASLELILDIDYGAKRTKYHVYDQIKSFAGYSE